MEPSFGESDKLCHNHLCSIPEDDDFAFFQILQQKLQ